ncbi:MAG: hypothetical protein VXZ96_19595 [Myxococcota bacterium]|nr:hypothetical protein [Myxococcota bacterium]
MFIFFLSAPVLAQGLGPIDWVQHVLSHQPALEATRLEVQSIEALHESIAVPLPAFQVGLAPISLSPDSPLGIQAQISQTLPIDLQEQRRVLEVERAIAETTSAHQVLMIQHAALYDYAQWLEHCDKWSLSQAHEQVLLQHRDAVNARILSNKSQFAHQLLMESKHAQQQQVSVRWEGECMASGQQLQRWVPDLDMKDMTPAVEWPPNGSGTSDQHPQIEGISLRIDSANAESEVWEKKKRPTPGFMAQFNTMNPMPEHHWMIGGQVSWTRPQKRKSVQNSLWLEQEKSKAQQMDTQRQLLTAKKKSETRLESLKVEYRWLEQETLPRLKSEREALLALFDSAQIPLASVIDVEHRLLAQKERQLEILADSWRTYADWSLASNTVLVEVNP